MYRELTYVIDPHVLVCRLDPACRPLSMNYIERLLSPKRAMPVSCELLYTGKKKSLRNPAKPGRLFVQVGEIGDKLIFFNFMFLPKPASIRGYGKAQQLQAIERIVPVVASTFRYYIVLVSGCE